MKQSTKKRILAMLCASLITAAMVPATAMTVGAETLANIEVSGQDYPVLEMGKQNLAEGSEEQSSIYQFTPSESGYYQFSLQGDDEFGFQFYAADPGDQGSSYELYHPGYLYCFAKELVAGQTYYLEVNGSYQVEIGKAAAPQTVNLGKSVSISSPFAVYTFTPPESGNYRFTFSGDAKAGSYVGIDSSAEGYCITFGLHHKPFSCKKGEPVTILVSWSGYENPTGIVTKTTNEILKEGVASKPVLVGDDLTYTAPADGTYTLSYSGTVKDPKDSYLLCGTMIYGNTTQGYRLDGQTKQCSFSLEKGETIRIRPFELHNYDAVQYTIRHQASSISSSKPSFTAVKNVTKGVQLQWSKIKGASGYEIYRKTENGKAQKIATVSGSSYVDKTAVSGKRYTYTVRAYAKANGKTVRSKMSSAKSITVSYAKYQTKTVVNYRANPSTSGAVKGILAKGKTVNVVKGYSKKASGHTWYQIKMNGKTYYIAADCLKQA
ncbi:MAG: SH3 domain-containing protein [Oscillospiraceae bacterium]|nr:SH3 domain-containing protein [Oscillospiraceae bacterium]